MKILTITAQKPHSTGSGFYLTEMVKGFAALGHEQAVLAGVYREDTVDFLIDQNGYVQGYQPPRILAELLAKGIKPEKEFLFTDINIKMKYNL